ncbi:MAG: hypothetical protein U9N86_16920 [Bacteroidota bacterium]|nr:hypothetical protein [Bacteroidota bacterium]
MAFKLRIHIIILVISFAGSELKSQEATSANYYGYRETVWIESDRHLYLAGETISFRAKVFEQDTYLSSMLSKNLRFELIDPNGIPVIQRNIQLSESKMLDNIQLPEDAQTGWYYLRAYTNWMRNFPTSEYGWLPVKVVNPVNVNLDPIQKNPVKVIPDEQNNVEYLLVQDNKQSVIVTISDQSNIGDKRIRLIMHQSYTILWDSDNSANSEHGFIIPKEILPTGIMQLSLLGEDGRILAKRLWSEYDPESARINVSPEKDKFQIRASYFLDLSQSVFYEDMSVYIGLDEPGNPLESFIPGLPGWNCTYSIPGDPQAFKEWLRNNSYSDELVLSLSESEPGMSQNSHIQHLPETRSGIISGQVINSNTGLGADNTGICLNILNDNYFDAAKTESDGRFFFALPGYSASTDYILGLTSVADSSLQIKVTPLFDPRLNNLLNNFALSEEELLYLQVQSINMQLNRIYGVDSKPPKSLLSSFIVKQAFFHPPDYTVVLDDYIKLANIREVIYEVVPNVIVRQKDGHEYLKVYNDNPFSTNYKTLVLLDGIPLAHPKDLLDLPPDRIEFIEVKDKMYIHGRSIFASIVNFVSPNKDYAGLDLPENSVLSTLDLPKEGTQLQLFNSEVKSTLPQLANTLLWESGVSLHKDSVQFSTNDQTGNFNIMVYGFDKNGNWVCGKHNFEVGNKN